MITISRRFAQIALCLFIGVSHSYAGLEHHQLQSKFLSDAGETDKRELSIYVPDVPPRSAEGYPVFYLFHGYTGTNRTFIGAGYPNFGELIDSIHVDQMMDELIGAGTIEPIMVVFPNVNRQNSLYDAYTGYVTEEIISFVDANFSTIATREARSIAGHSVGGSDSIQMGLRRPDLFSLIVAYSPYFLYSVDESLLSGYDPSTYPLDFWIYAGEKDDFPKIPPETHDMVELLKTHGVPCISTFDDNDHWDMIGAMISESIVHFSSQLSESRTAISITTWGELKTKQR
ncbi:MAG: hypothetical protein HOC74_12305 [Gemmatimonadetes bacterium]|jgi:S-formylglutathione hydrolase FrmB|nr:hypothetical protein [Gemmatimonadota bacterium]